MVGITGTNGKTTTAFLVRQLLEAAGTRCGLLGTVKQVVGGRSRRSSGPRPRRSTCSATFARMLEAGDEACAMEVSSHALVLHRADAIHFAVKVFTNLTQDHLDFHADMEDYFAAKRLLFSGEGGAPLIELEGGVSVINLDDPYGRRLAEELSLRLEGDCVTYSAAGAEADLSARDVTFDATGSRFVCLTPEGEIEVRDAAARATSTSPTRWRPSAVAHALGLDLARPRAAARLGGAGAGPLRADRRGPALRRARRLRPHARLAGERAAARRGG